MKMTSRERVLARLQGSPVDQLPLMPITMMFACDHRRRPLQRLLHSFGSSRAPDPRR